MNILFLITQISKGVGYNANQQIFRWLSSFTESDVKKIFSKNFCELYSKNNNGNAATDNYSVFTIISCLDIQHIEYCINLTGGGRRKGDEKDGESFRKDDDSQQKEIDDFISAFCNLDLFKVADIDEREGVETCHQYVLPEVELWVRNKEDNSILEGIYQYRDRCTEKDKFDRITVQELYVGLGKYFLHVCDFHFGIYFYV